jgi:hypothetical protein
VSLAYLQQATTPQADNATPDDYGFGWWVCEDGPYASGLGGQSIRVFPRLDLVAVMTACGSDWDAVSGLLEPTLISEEQPLPADPAGEKRLAEQVLAIAATPPAKPAAPLPQAALDAAGLTYRFPANSALLVALRLYPDSAEQVRLQLTWSSSTEAQTWPIGLDGNYRLSDYGDALRGDWVEGNTLSFLLRTAREIGIKVTFEGKKATLTSASSGLKVEGQAQ